MYILGYLKARHFTLGFRVDSDLNCALNQFYIQGYFAKGDQTYRQF